VDAVAVLQAGVAAIGRREPVGRKAHARPTGDEWVEGEQMLLILARETVWVALQPPCADCHPGLCERAQLEPPLVIEPRRLHVLVEDDDVTDARPTAPTVAG